MSFIGGGCQNCIDADAGGSLTVYGTIAGGEDNKIRRLSDNSFIGGRGSNEIGTAAGSSGSIFGTISGGYQNCILDGAAYGAIGGGQANMVCTATAHHAAILGGANDCVGGACSVILGGSGNDASYDYTAIFGNALAATMSLSAMGVPSALLVDELVNLPVDTTPTGTGPYACLL